MFIFCQKIKDENTNGYFLISGNYIESPNVVNNKFFGFELDEALEIFRRDYAEFSDAPYVLLPEWVI